MICRPLRYLYWVCGALATWMAHSSWSLAGRHRTGLERSGWKQETKVSKNKAYVDSTHHCPTGTVTPPLYVCSAQETKHWPSTFTRWFGRQWGRYELFQTSAGHQPPTTISFKPSWPQNAADPNTETSWWMWDRSVLLAPCPPGTLKSRLDRLSVTYSPENQTNLSLNLLSASPQISALRALCLRLAATWKWTWIITSQWTQRGKTTAAGPLWREGTTVVLQPVGWRAGSQVSGRGSGTWWCHHTVHLCCLRTTMLPWRAHSTGRPPLPPLLRFGHCSIGEFRSGVVFWNHIKLLIRSADMQIQRKDINNCYTE